MFISFSPKELFPAEDIVKLAEGYAKESGAHVLITDNADEAVKGADVLYTDVWVSMGEEDKFAERKSRTFETLSSKYGFD